MKTVGEWAAWGWGDRVGVFLLMGPGKSLTSH